jgi:tRNA pseudouridine38-40 synthase
LSRVALVLAHDGTDYAGWQFQPGLRTIQGVLEGALSTACGRRVVPHASGRTDSGVHAEGQVAHADVGERWRADPMGLRGRLAGLLDQDLRVRAVVPVDGGFDARKSALSKRYRYRMHLASLASPLTWRFRTLVSTDLDLAAMGAAAGRFVGERDFAALQTTGSSVQTSVRAVTRCGLEGEPPEVDLVVEGSGFLRHMVRAIAGCLLEIGRGRRDPAWIDEVLESRDRRAAAANAPARGLCLECVAYPEPWMSLIQETLLRQERPHAAAEEES